MVVTSERSARLKPCDPSPITVQSLSATRSTPAVANTALGVSGDLSLSKSAILSVWFPMSMCTVHRESDSVPDSVRTACVLRLRCVFNVVLRVIERSLALKAQPGASHETPQTSAFPALASNDVLFVEEPSSTTERALAMRNMVLCSAVPPPSSVRAYPLNFRVTSWPAASTTRKDSAFRSALR